MVRIAHLAFVLLVIVVQVAALVASRRYTILNNGYWARTTPSRTRAQDYIALTQEPKELNAEYLWEFFPFPYDNSLFRIKNIKKGYTAAAAEDKSGSEIVAKQFGASNWRIYQHPEENKHIIRLDNTKLVWTRAKNTIRLEEYQNKFSQLWSFYPGNDWYDGLYIQ
ncbi:hypothetical protein BGZ73_002528 [Actinomortierella ambigua]|nr:hypothetical protein BGZ73_002528 [Actinomortierella ambigua]